MVILVDVDETIEELLNSWTHFLNKQYGTNVVKDNIKEWDMSKSYPTLTFEQLYGPLSTKEFWEDVREVPNAGHYLQRLIKDGNDVILLTSSYYSTIQNKIEHMINRLFPFIPWDNVIVTTRKYLVRGDVMIDDYEQNLIPGDWETKILIDEPYNRDFNEREYGIIRVKSWDEIYNIINNVKEMDA